MQALIFTGVHQLEENQRLKIGLDRVFDIDYNEVAMAKYDSLRKIERNKMLCEYAESHPELSLKEIGRVFNISESRVWRILIKGKKHIAQTTNRS